MRFRALIAGAGLALIVLFVAANPAAADTDKERKECIEKLEAGKDIDDCQKAPSPILPATNELVWGTISFAVLFGALYFLAWPALKKGLEGRADRIRESLEEAEGAKQQAEQILSEYQSQLADARNESGRIIEEARQTADALRRQLEERAQADINDLRQRAQEDIEAAKNRAVAEVREQVAELAIGAAERVVERNLDRETNRALVEHFIERVGSGNGAGSEQMADRIDAYASALFEVARAEGRLERIEADLFSFAQTLQQSDELRTALTDQGLPASRRQQIVEDLLGDRADPIAAALVSFVVGAGHARDLPEIIDRMVRRAAEEHDREVAEVRSAIPLDEEQKRRLAEALSHTTGKQIEVRVIVDPQVLGGIVAQIGDTVIDGSVRHRLEELKARL